MYLASFAVVFPLMVTLPWTTAQRPARSCFTADAFGTSPKPYATFYQSTTSTEFRTEQEVLTTTLTGGVPDHTITIHEKSFRTQHHEGYIDTYVSTKWETETETLPRPTITLTVAGPAGFLVDNPVRRRTRKKRDEEEEDRPVEKVGQVMPLEPEQKPTKVNTVLCNRVFHTTQTETTTLLSVLDKRTPERTITLTITNTETVDEFATPPRTTETETKTTTYKTYTTTFEMVTASTPLPYGR